MKLDIRGKLILGAFLVVFLLGLHGAFRFPAAPIRHMAGRYVDKLGNEHTEREYRAFETWKKSFAGTWCVAAVAWGIGWYRSRKTCP